MQIALISDIHGNLVSLDAVLAVLDRDPVERVVCLGDAAATGPQPREVIDRLRALGCPVVLGNADAWLLDPRRTERADEDTRRFEETDAWCAQQLTPDDLEYLRTFQPTIELDLGDDQRLLCFHGSPASYDDVVTATTPDEGLARMLGCREATVLAGGHTHVQMVRRYGRSLLLNPGSVGLPYEFDPATGEARNPPWAEYAVVTCVDGSLSVELRRVPVDVDAVVAAIRESGMPHAAWWAADWR